MDTCSHLLWLNLVGGTPKIRSFPFSSLCWSFLCLPIVHATCNSSISQLKREIAETIEGTSLVDHGWYFPFGPSSRRTQGCPVPRMPDQSGSAHPPLGLQAEGIPWDSFHCCRDTVPLPGRPPLGGEPTLLPPPPAISPLPFSSSP